MSIQNKRASKAVAMIFIGIFVLIFMQLFGPFVFPFLRGGDQGWVATLNPTGKVVQLAIVIWIGYNVYTFFNSEK